MAIDKKTIHMGNPMGSPRETKELTGNYTLDADDNGKQLYYNSTSNYTLTLPADADADFPIGSEITLLRLNTGTVTVAAGSGATVVAGASYNATISLKERYAEARCRKVLANTWVVSGNLTAA